MVTLSYAAPEKVLGDHCGPEADIYSLGVLLWELVTSEIPYRGQLRWAHVTSIQRYMIMTEEGLLLCTSTQRPSFQRML